MARRTRQKFKISIKGYPNQPDLTRIVEALDERDAVSQAGGGSTVIILPVPAGTKVGVPVESSAQVSLTVENLGAVPRKRNSFTAEERAVKAAAKAAERLAKEAAKIEAGKQREAEQRRRILTVRKHIVNQIELAFEKKMKTATEFVTCEYCHEQATQIVVQRTPEGSSVPFEDIVGARCANHAKWHKEPFVDCNKIEFFYDGLRQLHINKAAA